MKKLVFAAIAGASLIGGFENDAFARHRSHATATPASSTDASGIASAFSIDFAQLQAAQQEYAAADKPTRRAIRIQDQSDLVSLFSQVNPNASTGLLNRVARLLVKFIFVGL